MLAQRMSQSLEAVFPYIGPCKLGRADPSEEMTSYDSIYGVGAGDIATKSEGFESNIGMNSTMCQRERCDDASDAPSGEPHGTMKATTTPAGVHELLYKTLYELQTEFTHQVGEIFHGYMKDEDSLHKIGKETCHSIMALKLRSDQKRNFVKYTVAFAHHANSTTVDDPNKLIDAWWSEVRPDKTKPVPKTWFDMQNKLGPQLTSVAMCAMAS